MEVELLEIRDFLAAHPPFAQLPAEALDRLPKSVSIRYLRRGASFPPGDAGGDYLYLLRQGAVEVRSDRDELVAKYGEGDLYGALRAGEDETRGLSGRAVEDSLLYLLPGRLFDELRANHPDFDRQFARSLRDKLRRTLDALQSAPALGGGLMAIDVGSLVKRGPVHVAPETSIEEAARVMSRERVSSLLVMRQGQLEGILTDRDLRQRCLAAGLPPQRPVREIMTTRLHRIARESPAFEALLAMTRLGIHHLPVMDRDRVAGVVTTTDLTSHQSANTVYLVGGLRRSESVAALAQACARLPELQVQMVAAGAAPRHLGQAVSAVTYAVTQRLLELAEARLGGPPVPYAWLACGSQARHEQTALSDQDNALLLSEDYRPEEHDAYFGALARFVNDGLAGCGFARCPGQVMADNPSWRQPLGGWERHFDGWIERPESKALMHASIFFDMRVVSGDEAALRQLQASVHGALRGNQIFLARLAINALRNRPPIGFFRSFVLIHGGEHGSTLDLKRGGIMPVVDLARVRALEAGSTALGTVERLRAAADTEALSRAGAEDLEDALDFVSALRARHQAELIKQGLAPDNYVAPEQLSLLERSQLREVFAVIRRQQQALAERYQVRRLG
jgi:CBS domain-containing protein